jgi:ribosome modulation factor
MRIKKADLVCLVNICNGAGSTLILDHSNGGYRIETNGGSKNLSPRGTAREIFNWLLGYSEAMIAMGAKKVVD